MTCFDIQLDNMRVDLAINSMIDNPRLPRVTKESIDQQSDSISSLVEGAHRIALGRSLIREPEAALVHIYQRLVSIVPELKSEIPHHSQFASSLVAFHFNPILNSLFPSDYDTYSPSERIANKSRGITVFHE